MNESGTLVATLVQAGAMDAAAILAIGSLVTALTQITKRVWPGDMDEWGPLFAVLWSCVAVALWLWSQPEWPPRRTDSFAIAVGLAGILLSATGVYGIATMTTKTLSFKARRARSKARQPEPIPPAVPGIPEPSGEDAHVVVPTEMPVAAPVRRPRPRPAVEDEVDL